MDYEDNELTSLSWLYTTKVLPKVRDKSGPTGLAKPKNQGLPAGPPKNVRKKKLKVVKSAPPHKQGNKTKLDVVQKFSN